MNKKMIIISSVLVICLILISFIFYRLNKTDVKSINVNLSDLYPDDLYENGYIGYNENLKELYLSKNRFLC